MPTLPDAARTWLATDPTEGRDELATRIEHHPEAPVTEPTGTASGPLAVLSAGAAALARAADLDTALAIIVEAGASAVGADQAALFIIDPDRAGPELLLSLGLADDDAEALRRAVSDEADHPIHRAALDRTGSLGRAFTAPDGSAMTAADLPLVVAGGGVEAGVGVLVFGWSGSHEVVGGEEVLLVAVADLAAGAVASFRSSAMAAERAEWFERVAHTDPLTGLSNARTLNRVLELEVARAQRQNSEVSVAMFDIDGFSSLNQDAGSRVGDAVLRQVAAVLAETVRLVDTVARTGGDEFVIVAPGSAGLTVARRVLDGIASLESIEGRPVSISAGVSRFPQDGTSAESLIAAARSALDASSGSARISEAVSDAGA
jgi:diguanylate cyclase (GGDEF)-like protein